ncbi:MAG: radical SAM protein [Planctomycetota bacterium]
MTAIPDYTPKSNEAEWHITYKCDLACPNCNRLCFLPPTTQDMTLDDAREFNRQAQELNWSPKIVILGGEPTLHRDLFGFIEIANELSPGRVEIWSNGYRDAAKEILSQIRDEGNVKVCEETIKACGSEVLQHSDFFLAPIDFGVIDHRPCHNHAAIGCGISVDAEGYAACSIGGAIDSVLELGIRTKNLKDLFDKEFVHKQTCSLCDVCGRELGITSHHIAKSQVMHGSLMSPTWQKAVKRIKDGGCSKPEDGE